MVPQIMSPVGRVKSGLLYPYRTPTRRLQPLRYREGVLFRDVDTSVDEVGHVCLTAFPADRELYIDYFEVAAAFRGQGYGREMYQWVEGYARRRGMRQILLTPYDAALPFWLRMGFHVISTETYEMMKPLR